MMLFETVTKNILDTENPVQWKPRNELEVVPEDMIGRLKQKIEEKSAFENFQFESIILNVTVGYEYYLDGKLEESINTLDSVQNKLVCYKVKGCEDSSVNSCLPALLHIVTSTRACVLLQKGDSSAAHEASCAIPSISEMDQHNRAALSGFKASFYAEYGVCGSKFGIKFAVKAIELDPEDSLWYFLKGKLLGRVRRVENPFDIPAKAELDALEAAIAKELNPAYTVFTAEVYRETAYRVFTTSRDQNKLFPLLKKKIDRMNEESFRLYKKSLELKTDDPHMMFRCAKGFLKLPEPFRDDKLAKELLKKGLIKAPDNPFGHHVMAQYYERREKNFVLAVKHLRICEQHKVYGARMDLLRIQINQKELTPEKMVSTLNNLYEEYPEPTRRCQTLSQLASFYIFEQPNLHKAYDYVIRIFRLNINCVDINKHRPLFLRIFHPVSLTDILIDEIKIKLQGQDTECGADERKQLEEYLTDLRELGIPVSCSLPKYLKNRAIEISRPGMISRNRSNVNTAAKPQIRRANYRNEIPIDALTYRQNRDKFKKPSLQTQSEIIGNVERFAKEWKKNVVLERGRVVPKNITTDQRNKDAIYDDNSPDAELKDDDEDSDMLFRINTYKTALRTGTEKRLGERTNTTGDEKNWRRRRDSNAERGGRYRQRSPEVTELEKEVEHRAKTNRRFERDNSAEKGGRYRPRFGDVDIIDEFERMRLSNKNDGDVRSKRSNKTKVCENEESSMSSKYTATLSGEVDSDFEESVLAYRKMKQQQAQSKSGRTADTASQQNVRPSISSDSKKGTHSTERKYNKNTISYDRPNRNTKYEQSAPPFLTDSKGDRNERNIGRDRSCRYKNSTDEEKFSSDYESDRACSRVKSQRKVHKSNSSSMGSKPKAHVKQSTFFDSQHSDEDDEEPFLNEAKKITASTFEPKNIRF